MPNSVAHDRPAAGPVSVFGAGAWGTALASHIACAQSVTLWGRDASVVDAIEHQQLNPRYLAGVSLSSNLHAVSDFSEAARFALRPNGLWIIATPMSGLRSTLAQLLSIAPVAQWPSLLWLCKGFEVDTGLLPHQVVQACVGEVGGALSGPSFALEVAKGLPCALTVASKSAVVQAAAVAAVHHGHMRIYAEDDLIGVEVGGAVKNIMAVATGICDGLQLGLNARAALMTRGMAEIRRLAVALGANSETLNGLAGFGDLMLTCTGDLSRNRRVGLMLAEGLSLSDILNKLGQVAEGVRCAPVVRQKAAELVVDMPITQTVCEVLFSGLKPQDAVAHLLARQPKRELV